MKKQMFLALSLVLAFVSCDKKAQALVEPKVQAAATAEPQAQCDVYLAGSAQDKNGDLVPTVWKNGKFLTRLDVDSSAILNAFVLVGQAQ
jgi:uncharacterized lipoprotein NlpE involved in copper resistance